MNNTCPKAEKCPIFSGVLSGKNFTTRAYKSTYCEAGESGRNICKRWEAANSLGSVPDGLLPNSSKDIREIAKDLNLVVN